MNRFLIVALVACLRATLCHADYQITPMPQGTPPQISEATKQVIRSSIQASPKLPATAAASSVSAPTGAPPKNLVTKLYGGASANNFDNQHAFHEKIKQHLKSHPNH